MLNMNDEMKKIILVENSQELDENTHIFLKEIVSKTKIIKDCIIYDDEGINELDINFDRILKFVGNLTGYEVGCNDFRLEKNVFKTNQYEKLASDLNNMLKNKYKNRKFVVYICVNFDCIEIRFHTYRATEGFWLGEDLSGYSNPILCLM